MVTKRLKDYTGNRNYNLDLLKFISSIMVIVSHAYVLSTGLNVGEPLYELTDGYTMGTLAVSIFFWASGFYITKSIMRNQDNNFYEYIKKRYIRLAQPLIIVVLLCLIMGLFVTNYTFKEYITSSQTWRYLLNGIMILQHNLPGVFLENAYVPTVNGALWTLPVEIVLYIGTYVIYKLGILNEKFFKYTTVLVLLIVFLSPYMFFVPGVLQSGISAATFFYTGMLCWIYREKIIVNGYIALVALVVYILSFSMLRNTIFIRFER